MSYTRLEFGTLALGVVPAALAANLPAAIGAQASRPDSTVRGVRIGLNLPYNFGNNNMPADEVLRRCLAFGVSAVELRSQPVEGFLGVPADLVAAAAAGGRNRTPEQIAAQRAAADRLRQWRVSASMDRVREFRRTWEDAGVSIEIVKFDGLYARADDEVDYCFELAKQLGARAISCEIDVPQTKRIGQFADRHQLMVGYHGHAETTPAHWEEAFSYARFNGANLDIGHFVAGNNPSPIPFLSSHHDRITHIPVKDRKMHDGPNTPFGEGDTPIREVLRTIRDRQWNIQATIEFEYPIPAGSDRMAEIAKCVAYCRDALA
jgi:sugar phosphate isomerase/epimerase